MKPVCSRCNKNPAVVHPVLGILQCSACDKKDAGIKKKNPPEFYSQHQADRIREERDAHAADTVQPWIGNKPNPEFVKIYPDKAQGYFSKEELRESDV